ncbi:MAG: response regulator transcription factor [Candidatus Pseudobacter hemicellulosilyticus]|uniref:Response regulator transcription factor n=1 Tax=Candidatus Pseudobacter hemicellulosilyticus TaxID=3121375 RepID=A0AAJ5WPG2_9BACT|nr:MAG: response regulator transcription factor [Pseudobacter sp.]
MKVLVIEDEKELADSIGAYLSGENYRCEFAASFPEAIDKIFGYDYDCILLDLMLPGGDGIRLLEEIKANNKQEGVIIISARNSVDDKIKGLHLGADDYLAKPFHLPELAARIYSVIRRKHFGNTNTIRQHELSIDLLSRTLTVNDQEVILTRKEFDLLLFFISNKNRVVSKSALAEHLSGEMADMFDNYDFVYAHIKNLKKKLTEAGYGNYLKTLYGSGYKWDV